MPENPEEERAPIVENAPDLQPASAYVSPVEKKLDAMIGILSSMADVLLAPPPPTEPDAVPCEPGVFESVPGAFTKCVETNRIAYMVVVRVDEILGTEKNIIRPSVGLHMLSETIRGLLYEPTIPEVQDYRDTWLMVVEILERLSQSVADTDEDIKLAMKLEGLMWCNETQLSTADLFNLEMQMASTFKSIVASKVQNSIGGTFGDLSPGEAVDGLAYLVRKLAPKTGRALFAMRNVPEKTGLSSPWVAQPWAEFLYRILKNQADELLGVPVPATPPPGYDPGFSHPGKVGQ